MCALDTAKKKSLETPMKFLGLGGSAPHDCSPSPDVLPHVHYSNGHSIMVQVKTESFVRTLEVQLTCTGASSCVSIPALGLCSNAILDPVLCSPALITLKIWNDEVNKLAKMATHQRMPAGVPMPTRQKMNHVIKIQREFPRCTLGIMASNERDTEDHVDQVAVGTPAMGGLQGTMRP